MLLPKAFMVQPACANNGFVALITVILIASIGAVIVSSALLLGIGSSRSSFALVQSSQAKALADACVEEALQKLRESIYYAGSETLNFTNGSCQIQAISGTGNSNRTVQTISTVGTIQRKVTVVVGTVHPTISITSWQELADF